MAASAHMAPAPLADVIEEHLQEAGFLYSLWEASLEAPDFGLAQVAGGEEARLLAHLDGLVVGGEQVARRWLLPLLEEEEEPELLLAAALALLAGAGEHGAAVAASLLAAEDEELAVALTRALELGPAPADLRALLVPLLVSPGGRARAAAVRVLAFHRRGEGVALDAYLSDADPEVRRAALLLARGPAGGQVLPALTALLDDPDEGVVAAALEAGLVHGLSPAWRRCMDLCAGHGEAASAALELVALLGTAGDLSALEAALGGARHEHALFCLGLRGTPRALDLCARRLEGEDPRQARLAAEAICAATGLDLATSGMICPETPEAAEEELPDLEDDDLEQDLVPDPVDALPLPDGEKVRAWWAQSRAGIDADQRCLAGQVYGPQTVSAVMAAGPMRRRHALARELRVRSAGSVDLETRTWAVAQHRSLVRLTWPDPRAFASTAEELMRW